MNQTEKNVKNRPFLTIVFTTEIFKLIAYFLSVTEDVPYARATTRHTGTQGKKSLIAAAPLARNKQAKAVQTHHR